MEAGHESTPTTPAPGVSREDFTWGFVLKGSRDALISSGLVKEDWFADGQQRDKRGVRRHKHLTVDGRKIRTHSPVSGDCSVYVFYPDAQCTQARAQREVVEVRSQDSPEERRRTAALRKAHAFWEITTHQTEATFKVGDTCLVFAPGCETDGQLVEIVEGFDLYPMGDSEIFRWGYVARTLGGRPYFYPPHQLSEPDGSVRHLRLIQGSAEACGHPGDDDPRPAA